MRLRGLMRESPFIQTALLVEALIAHSIVSARMLAEEGNVSLASAGRALITFEKLGLITEVTGGGRFRFWRMHRGAIQWAMMIYIASKLLHPKSAVITRKYVIKCYRLSRRHIQNHNSQ